MENELLKVFDDNRNQIGVASREEVHRLGYWHEAFHFWFISKENDSDHLYLQLRSHRKKDYPNLLDITAAGHLHARETVCDGIREIKEEIGIDLSFQELIPLGIIEYRVIRDDFLDSELAHVFLYKSNQSIDDFILQEEEVAGMVKVEFNHFLELWSGKRDSVNIKGYVINIDGDKSIIDNFVGRDQFVPHPTNYYQTIIGKIKDNI